LPFLAQRGLEPPPLDICVHDENFLGCIFKKRQQGLVKLLRLLQHEEMARPGRTAVAALL
jgi:hypothetical protein